MPRSKYGRALAWTVVAILLTIFGVGSLLVDFQVATSKTTAESTVNTGTHDPAGGAGTAGISTDSHGSARSLSLYVEGDDTVAAAFRRDLLGLLQQQPRFSRAILLQAPPSATEYPVIAAAITGGSTLWTPVYSRARLEVSFAYASDTSDISLRGDEPFVFAGREPAVRVRGKVGVTDETRGLISRLAYANHLGQALAQEVAIQLQHAIEMKPT